MRSLSLALLSASLLSGCVVVHDHTYERPAPVTCAVPTFDNFQGQYPAFAVEAGGSFDYPSATAGYAITSNGDGTYHLVWTDPTNDATCFTGLVTGVSAFSQSQVTAVSGYETITLKQDNQIAFASVPGAALDGVDFFASADPVYLDVFADGVAITDIYFRNAATGAVEVTGENPVAFSSNH